MNISQESDNIIENDEKNTDSLINELNIVNSEIQYIIKRRNQLENVKKDIERDLYYTCNHEFILDNKDCYDDICKYICKKCKCYENEYMYKNYTYS